MSDARREAEIRSSDTDAEIADMLRQIAEELDADPPHPASCSEANVCRDAANRLDELARLRAAPDASDHDLPVTSFVCAARKQSLPEPADCDWPLCSCDDYAGKVIAALQECDLIHRRPATDESDLARATRFLDAYRTGIIDQYAVGQALALEFASIRTTSYRDGYDAAKRDASGASGPTDEELAALIKPVWRKVKPAREAQSIRSVLSVEFDDPRWPQWVSDFIPDYVWDLVDIAAQRGLSALNPDPPVSK